MRWLGWLKRTRKQEDARLREWRTHWTAAVEAPSAERAAVLRRGLVEIGLEDDEHEIEREMLEGLEALVAVNDVLLTSGPAPVETGHRAVGSDRCYFSAPASLPDDPGQPAGTLLLTGTRAIFVGGARAVTIPWHGVGSCARQDRDVLLVRTDRPDLHRLRCNSYGDALRAAALVRHFMPRRRV
jgi:hypothetical protein